MTIGIYTGKHWPLILKEDLQMRHKGGQVEYARIE
jgi:hypothetical protein